MCLDFIAVWVCEGVLPPVILFCKAIYAFVEFISYLNLTLAFLIFLRFKKMYFQAGHRFMDPHLKIAPRLKSTGWIYRTGSGSSGIIVNNVESIL